MLNRSLENEESKKEPEKWAKITQSVPFLKSGERCEFFMYVTTSAMSQRSISKASEKGYSVILKKWWSINTDRKTDKLKRRFNLTD